MAYVNPLHPPVPSSQISRYSSLEGASGYTTFVSQTRHRLPQRPWRPISKWKMAMGQTTRLHAAIQFDHIGYNGQGIQMRELSARSLSALRTMLHGADDPVLAHIGGRQRITLRILWPGYEHVEWIDQIELDYRGSPITRAHLGAVIAENFARFVEKTRKEFSYTAKWKLTSSGIRYEHLVLVALVNTWDGVWQADVAVDLR